MHLTTHEIELTLACYQLAMAQKIKESDRRDIQLLFEKWQNAINANGGFEELAERIG